MHSLCNLSLKKGCWHSCIVAYIQVVFKLGHLLSPLDMLVCLYRMSQLAAQHLLMTPRLCDPVSTVCRWRLHDPVSAVFTSDILLAASCLLSVTPLHVAAMLRICLLQMCLASAFVGPRSSNQLGYSHCASAFASHISSTVQSITCTRPGPGPGPGPGVQAPLAWRAGRLKTHS